MYALVTCKYKKYRIKNNRENVDFGLVWFLFYGPSTHSRSFRAQSVTLTTLLLGKPPRQFTSANNWQLLFLNQRKRENGRRNFFITKSPRKNVPDVGRKRLRHRFPHCKSMGAFCCHGNQSFIQSAPNPCAAFSHPSDATHKIWSRLANWLQRYSSLKVWATTTDDDDGRTTDHWYTISSPCEPSAQVS